MRILRDYQRKALRYLLAKKSGALFVEMRLGKTLVVVRYARVIGAQRCLVVAPGSALGSWRKELTAEGQQWIDASGGKSRDDRMVALEWSQEGDGGWLLINREGWRVLPEIRDVRWDLAVLDESIFVKNPQAQVTKFFHKMVLAKRRVVLTGTPDPEGVQDVYCQARFLWPAPMGFRDYWHFRAKTMEPHPLGFGWQMKPGAADAVRRWMGRHCFCLRRKDVGLRENRVHERREIVMDRETRKMYRQAEDAFQLREKTTLWAGQQWHWLRQLCGGFADGKLVFPAKMDALLELLTGELAREQVVVWSCYTLEIEALRGAIEARGASCNMVTGDVPQAVRGRRIDDFQSGRTRVLVLQQAVAQTGLDLSAADTAIYYSTPLGQAARAQTEDRILTVDKAKRGTPLLYVDLVVKDSVDEDAIELLERKDASAEATMARALQEAMRRRRSWA